MGQAGYVTNILTVVAFGDEFRHFVADTCDSLRTCVCACAHPTHHLVQFPSPCDGISWKEFICKQPIQVGVGMCTVCPP